MAAAPPGPRSAARRAGAARLARPVCLVRPVRLARPALPIRPVRLAGSPGAAGRGPRPRLCPAGPTGAGAPSQSTAPAIAIAVIPSASAWWIRQITALRSPASPGITSIRHNGRDRSRCWAKMPATAERSAASSPAPAAPDSTTCADRSSSGSGTHQGSPSRSASRRRSRGARSSRPAIEARSSPVSSWPWTRMTLQVCPATVAFSRARMLRSSRDSGCATGTDDAPPDAGVR